MASWASLCALLLIFSIQGTSSQTCLCARGLCASGWVQYQNSCYKAVNEPKNWNDAETTCQSLENSHLASAHSEEENDFIFHLMGKPQDYKNGEAYWLGAHDIAKKKSFVWSDGSRYDFQAFAHGQPDGQPGEHYLGYWKLEKGKVAWNDYTIKWKFPFPCKYNLKNSPCSGA